MKELTRRFRMFWTHPFEIPVWSHPFWFLFVCSLRIIIPFSSLIIIFIIRECFRVHAHCTCHSMSGQIVKIPMLRNIHVFSIKPCHAMPPCHTPSGADSTLTAWAAHKATAAFSRTWNCWGFNRACETWGEAGPVFFWASGMCRSKVPKGSCARSEVVSVRNSQY